MANSGDIYGSFNGESGGIFSLWVHWYITSQSTSLLRSYINVTWYISKNNASWQTYKYSTPWTLSGYDSGTTSVDLRGVAVNSWQQIVDTDITVQHGNDGRSTIQLSGTLDMSGTSAGVGSFNSGQITLDPIITACTAPTSITASGIIIPNGSFTVSWSGAAGGTNNSISGYDIYYKISSNGTAPSTSDYSGTTSITSTSTSGSQTFSVSSATRGYKIVCGIVVKGGAGPSFYSPIATGGLVTINSLPSAPTVVASETTIPSTGGNVVFTLSATDIDGQTLSYVYTGPEVSSKTAITSGQSISVTGGTYYFWSRDSLNEESITSTSIVITKNTEPAISASIFRPDYYLAQDTSKEYASAISVSVTANKTKAYVRLLYGLSEDGLTNILPLSNVTLRYDRSTYLGNYNINKLLKDYYAENRCVRVYFRLQVCPFDNYEDGTWGATYSQSGVYSIAAAPTMTTTWDSFYDGREPAHQIVSGYCWNKICIKYLEDASMTSRTISAKAGNTTIDVIKDPDNPEPISGNYRYLNIILPSDLTESTVITVTVTLSDGNITKTFTASRTELPVPSLGSLGMDPSTINIYTNTSNIELTCVAPCAVSSNKIVDSGTYKITKCEVFVANSNGTNATNYIVGTGTSSTNSGLSLTNTSEENTFTISMSGTPGIGSRSGTLNNDFLKFGDFGKTTYNGTSIGYTKIVFTNKYGRTFTSGYKAYTLNYNTDPEFRGEHPVTMQFGSGTSTLLKVQEGLSVKAYITYKASSNSVLTFKLYYQIGNNGTWTLASTTAKAIGNQTATTNDTITTNSFTIPEITSTTAWNWKVILTNNITSTIIDSSNIESVSINAVQHIAPVLNLIKITPIETPNHESRTGITLEVESNDLDVTENISGLSGQDLKTIKYYLVNGSNNDIVPTSPEYYSTIPFKYVYDPNNTLGDKATWTQKTFRIECVTTVTIDDQTTTTKTGYSNQFTVYLDSPTIAYRKNRLGINTSTPDRTAVLDIYTQSGINFINLHDGSNGGMIQLNLLNHTIDIV